MFKINIILKSFATALVFVLPVIVSAEIQVTEIAWMGTNVSANDEWIEIYNNGNDSINLSGFTLTASDGTPSIALSGSIGAGEYKLLERTDDTTYPGINALVIFTGALGNEGENLTLKNGDSVVQSMNFAGGWPAGDVATKKTMQWTGSDWVTADETGGNGTTATTNEETEEEEEENTEEEVEEEEEEEQQENTEQETEVSGAGGGTKSVIKRTVYKDMVFELDFPSIAVAGNPTKFSAQALDFDRTKLRKGQYIFNMGDGTIRTFTKDFNGKEVGYFYHTYEYPGSYQISIEYYMTYFEENPPEVHDTYNIEVIDPNISITKVLDDGGVEIKNNSKSHIDISGWFLSDTYGKKFEFPNGTTILSGRSSVFTKKITKIDPFMGVSLTTSTGAFVTTSIQEKVAQYKKALPKTEDPTEEIGEVLGLSSVEASFEDVSLDENEKDPNSLVWILLFIILVLVSVIAVLLLKKEERKEEYLLIEE